MPKDLSIFGSLKDSNELEIHEASMSVDEFDQLIREWVTKFISNLDPPPDLWERIKKQVTQLNTEENPCS